LLPSIGDFVLLALYSLLRVVPAFDTDLWWHLATGDLIRVTGAVPRADTYSHTALGQPWIAHEWLAEVAMSIAYGLAGLEAMATLQAVLLVAALAITYLHVRTTGALAAVYAPLLVLATLLVLPAAHPRPYLLTLVFLALLLLLLRCCRARRWALLASTAALFGVWANLHAGFALGLLALGLVLVGETWRLGRLDRELVALLGVALVASLLNPYGAKLLAYPLQYRAGSVHYQLITEWAPVGLHQPYGWLVLLVVFGTALLLAFRRAAFWQVDALLLAAFGYLGLSSVSNIPLLAIVIVPILARQLMAGAGPGLPDRLVYRARRYAGPLRTIAHWDRHLTGVTLTAVVMAAAVIDLARGPSDARAFDPALWPRSSGWDLPYEAASRLPLGEHDNLLNAYGWGGYITWATKSDVPVFVDGRADVYGEAILREYADATALAPGWRAILDGRGVRAVLVPPDVPLAEGLRLDEAWRVVHEDDRSVLFVR
jgi:hypothetical protein